MARKHDDDERSERRMRGMPDPRLSRSLEYGIAMLECFSPQRTAMGVVDFSEALGLGRSTAHRYASTLHALGYLEQDRHRKYRLSRRAFEPGLAAIGAIRASLQMGSALEDLRRQTGHTVSLAALDGSRGVYVYRLHAHGAGQHTADRDQRVGSALPLHCTALGKALIAWLPDAERRALVGALTLTSPGPNAITSRRRLLQELEAIRERGLALGDEEQAAGVRSVAAPAGAQGAARIALDVTVPSSAYPMRRLAEELGPLVKRAAERIAAGDPSAPPTQPAKAGRGDGGESQAQRRRG
jgi:IclR family pca regulon transcriptional regulator